MVRSDDVIDLSHYNKHATEETRAASCGTFVGLVHHQLRRVPQNERGRLLARLYFESQLQAVRASCEVGVSIPPPLSGMHASRSCPLPRPPPTVCALVCDLERLTAST